MGDGTTKTFYLSLPVADGGGGYTRAINKPNVSAPLAVPLTVKVGAMVTGATVSEVDGSVVFATAPADGAVLTWSGEFFVQVRFDMDYLPFSLDNRNGGGFITNGSVDLIEVLDE